MIIKKLELQGFKSFPERVKIIFHSGITVIVGPNGTGKSNIVDAILWVIGGTRQRALRGDKIEDVIFHGNQKKPALGMADVSLSLGDEEEKMLINHRVFRPGESEYRLNGKLVRLKDIQESLWKKSIAEKEYFIIEQGNIDRILTSKPQEKRQLLEEAAGTAYYKDKKRQTQSKLDQSEQNLIRLEDIISEVARAKNSLKRQASAAIKYRKLREEIRRLTMLNFRKKIEILEKSKREIQEGYNQRLEQEREILNRIKAEEKELASKNGEVWNLEKSIKENTDTLFTLKSELTRIDADIESNKKSIDFYAERREQAQKASEELEAELTRLDEELKASELNLTESKNSLKGKKLNLNKVTQDNRSTLEERTEKEKRVEALRNAYLNKISDRSEATNKAVKVEKELELIRLQGEKLLSQLKALHNLLEKCEKELGKIQEELSRLKNGMDERNKKLKALKENEAETLTTIESLNRKISELASTKEKDLHHLSLLRKLEEKEQTAKPGEEIPGAIGLLADIFETGQQDLPLIDTFWKEEAKSILIPANEFLKNFDEKNRGTYFLLPPDVRNDSTHEILSQPNVRGLLKSRVKPRPEGKKYLPYLQEAVVVEDIKSAITLWLRFPSFNFITLKGDVLFSSGLLKIGEKEEGIIALRQEIKELEEKITRTGKDLLPLTQDMGKFEGERRKIEEEILRESLDYREEEKKLTGIERRGDTERAEKERILHTTSLLSEDLKGLESNEKTLTQRLKDISSEQKKLEEEEKRAKEELKAAEKAFALHQEKHAESERVFYELKAEIELHEEKIRNLEYQAQALIRRKESLGQQFHSLQEEISTSKREETALNEKNRELSLKRKKSQGLRSEKDALLAQAESSLATQKKELQEQEKRIQNLKDEHEALKEERVKWEISKAEKERDLANLEEMCWQELKKTLKEVKEEVSEAELEGIKIEEKLEFLTEKLQKMREVNLMAEEEYVTQKERYDFLSHQKNDLRASIDTTQEAIKKIDEESKAQFLQAFNQVNVKFQEVFSLLFKGGKTELKLTEPDNPLESGVEIIAQPPGKKVQNMMLLSGGEKALTSLAFLFALFRYRPTPFCILDEVDAALDDANLSRFLDLMKNIKNQTQFLIITHNFKTMEVADYIYGTTMAEPNVTDVYSLKLGEREENRNHS